ncbi:hypothetical protein BJY59DRAFT_321157 [Rhodotorula toruloides]
MLITTAANYLDSASPPRASSRHLASNDARLPLSPNGGFGPLQTPAQSTLMPCILPSSSPLDQLMRGGSVSVHGGQPSSLRPARGRMGQRPLRSVDGMSRTSTRNGGPLPEAGDSRGRRLARI